MRALSLALATLGALVSPASAQLSVPADWDLVPSSLGGGDSFRLLFLSSTARDGSSTDIAAYDAFIQNLASNGHSTLADYATHFQAVGCTDSTDARDHTGTTYTASDKGVPIYWLNGDKVADDYEDFYDGDWDNETSDTNEYGNAGTDSGLVAYFPITGCDHDGTEASGLTLGSGSVRVGRPGSSDSADGPLGSNELTSAGNSRTMYGLSAVFTAKGVSVPEAPTNLTATARGEFQIDLSWTAPRGTGETEVTGYRIEVSSDGGTRWSELVADSGSDSTAYSHLGLYPGSTRHYRVSAVNERTAGPVSNVAGASAGLFLTNLDEARHSSSATITIGTARRTSEAIRFVTDSQPDGYVLTAVDIDVFDHARDAVATVEIHPSGDSDKGGPVPDSTGPAFQLVPPDELSQGIQRFTASSPIRLEPSTAYWVVITSEDSTRIQLATNDLVPGQHSGAGSVDGWSFHHRATAWTSPAQAWTSTEASNYPRVALYGSLDSFVSNITRVGAAPVATSTGPVAQGFTTGSSERAYAVHAVDLNFEQVPSSASQASAFAASLWSSKSDGSLGSVPDKKLVDLNRPKDLHSGPGLKAFTPVSSTALNSSTEYFVVLRFGGSDPVRLRTTDSNAEDPGSKTGWSVSDGHLSSDSDDIASRGVAGGRALAVRVRGSVPASAPPPSPPAVATVPSDWALTPSAIPEGGQFRLMFVTSGSRNAVSSDIGVYNTFVQQAAGTGHAELQPYRYAFRVLASTPDVDARDNTATTGTGVPIYWVDGNKIANDYPDLYDSEWAEELDTRNEHGERKRVASVWTGSNPDGTESINSRVIVPVSQALGATSWVVLGNPNTHGTSPLGGAVGEPTRSLSFWGLSPVFWRGAWKTLVTNLDSQADDGRGALVGTNPGFIQAIRFTTGTRSGSFDLRRLDLEVLSLDAGSSLTVRIHASVEPDGSTPSPGAALYTLRPPSSLGAGRLGFTAPANSFLQGRSAYWVVVSSDDEKEVRLLQNRGTGVHTGSGSEPGWQIHRTALRRTDEGTWTVPPVSSPHLRIRLYGIPVNFAPRFPAGAVSRTIEENAPPGAPVGRAISASDANDDTLSYSLSGTDAGMFEIDPGTGLIKILTPLDYESKASHFVTVTAEDGFGGSASVAVTILVQDELEPPRAPAPPEVVSVRLLENTLRVRLTAPDSAGRAPVTGYDLDYREAGDTGWRRGRRNFTFPVQSISGLSAGTEYEVRVRAKNTDGIGAWSDPGSGRTAQALPDELEVPPDWSLLPSGLRPGDRFRLLFITSGSRDAESTDIVDYNKFVQAAAESGHQHILPFSRHFRALGSTREVDARDNTGTTYTDDDKGVPIYWLEGYKAADDYEDFYDGTWGVTLTRDENGETPPEDRVFTGSTERGTEVIDRGRSYSLGAFAVRIGWPGSGGQYLGLDSGPDAGNIRANERFPIYGLSPVFAVLAAQNNWPLYDTGTLALSLAERSPVGTAVGSPVTADDHDGDTLTYSLEGPDAGSFEIDSGTAQITTRVPIAYGAKSAYYFKVTAEDGRGGVASANVMVEVLERVPLNWSLVPAGLGVGDRFRLLFITSGTRRALDTDIGAYNDFVQSAATTGHPAIRAKSRKFRVVGTTWNVAARDNTGTTYTSDDKGVPIYWLNGNKVADDYEDFYDDTWDDGDNLTNEHGQPRPVSNSPDTRPFTGSTADGRKPFPPDDIYALGGRFDGAGRDSRVGEPGNGPLSANLSPYQNQPRQDRRPFYGLSGIFTVGADSLPMFASASLTREVVENTPSGRDIGSPVTASDADTDEVTYSLEGVNARFFAIDPFTGQLKTLAPLDYEDRRLYEVTVRATDSRGGTTTVPVSVRVTDTRLEVPLTASFGAASYTASEGGTAASVTIQLSQAPGVALTIPITRMLEGGTDAGDFSGVPETLTFEAIEIFKTITVTATDDSEVESGESLRLGFGSLPSRVSVGEPATAKVNLEDNDRSAATVSFAASSYDAEEGGGAVAVVVQLNQATGAQVVIPITATHQGGAVAADYRGVPSELTFGPAETSRVVMVTADDDTVDDDDESVQLGFGTPLPPGVSLGSLATATVRLKDNDDPAVTVAFGESSYDAPEGGSGATVTVRLDQPPEREVEIPITATHRGGAVAADYTGVPSTVTFGSTETSRAFPVLAADDGDFESGESVELGFDILPDGVTAGTPGTATVSFGDNDGSEVTVNFGADMHDAAEGGTVATVEVLLNQVPGRELVIPITQDLQGGASSEDFSGVPPSVTLAATETSKTFTVQATDDIEFDPEESVQLGFESLPPGVTAGTRATTAVNFHDNDDPPPVPVDIPDDWGLKPPDVKTGDSFRLIFVSSGERDATSTDIDDYNAFVQNIAANGHTEIREIASRFRAVGCTDDTDARDNTGTTYSNADNGVPIYWVNGNKVADNYEDFYDGTWDDLAASLDESGEYRDFALVTPFTGCAADGTASTGGRGSLALGRVSVSLANLESPVGGGVLASATGRRPFFGLSPVITVRATVAYDSAVIPTGLGTGDSFRLLFLSSTGRDASSASIRAYNNFVRARAAAGLTEVQTLESQFRALVSTASRDARENTATTHTKAEKGVPIYWVGGSKVADHYADFYDGEWTSESNARDEWGNARSTSGSNGVHLAKLTVHFSGYRGIRPCTAGFSRRQAAVGDEAGLAGLHLLTGL